MQKFELCDSGAFHGGCLPLLGSGVDVFAVPGLGARWRLIEEPPLGAVVAGHGLPKATRPSRLKRPQSLRNAKRILQIGFELRHGSIAMPNGLLDIFFSVHGGTSATG